MASSRTPTNKMNLMEFPSLLRELDEQRLTNWTKDYRCIPRDKLTPTEINALTELRDSIYNKMDSDQKHAFNSMMNHTTDTKYTMFDTTNTDNDVVKMPITILNAPAGTGKSLVILGYQIATILYFGFKNGAIMYTPSYASLDAVVTKIRECFEDIYPSDGGDELITKNTECVRNCLPIYIINQFYACGPKSFNIHDESVLGKVKEHFKKKTSDKDLYKINNVQAMRETRAIIIDEAFFSTASRCNAFIDMLMDGYIDHPYLNSKIRIEFPQLLDRLIYRKKLVFSGDPYQLSVSVEQKEAGVEKYHIQEGHPLWYLKNKLRDCVRLSDNIQNPNHYQLLSLTKNYRFGPDVPADLRDNISNIRKVIYKNENGFKEYKERMKSLLECMDIHNMIGFNKRTQDVAEHIDKEDKHRLYTVSEVHAASKEINKSLDEKCANRHVPYIDVNTEFLYGKPLDGNLTWIPYEDYINANGGSSEFKTRYISECKNGIIANKFIGEQYPNQTNQINYIQHKLYIGDKVRITIPLTIRHDIVRVLDNNKKESLPETFKLHTGTFCRVVDFEGTTVLVEICNEADSNKYNSELKNGPRNIRLKNGYETTNPVFAIKYSGDLTVPNPYFKSAFCNYILPEKSFNSAVHSYPFTKESASTIHSLQGKTMSKNEKIIYFMHSIKKADLKGVIFNEVGAWKGCLPNLLYVALTRSKVPHNNFKLMTSSKTIHELLNNITGGKRPKSYNDLREFNSQFE